MRIKVSKQNVSHETEHQVDSKLHGDLIYRRYPTNRKISQAKKQHPGLNIRKFMGVRPTIVYTPATPRITVNNHSIFKIKNDD
jgi:hypothetical protein